MTGSATRPGDPAGAGPIITRFSEIEARPVDWLWRGYIPAGMLTVLDGDPGLGKSTLTDDLAARVSTGRAMPDGSAGRSPAGIVLLSAEDDLARTIRPRLEAAGADLVRVATIALHHPDGGPRAPAITGSDLEQVEEAIRTLGARLLVLDPLVAYLPDGIDSNRDHDVRRTLTALSDFAGRTDCAVLVVRHLRKSGAESPLYRGGGSIGITAAARAVFLLARDPDEPSGDRRVLAPIKTNLGPPPPSLAFRLVVGPGRDHPHLAWEGVSAHDAQASPITPSDQPTVEQVTVEEQHTERAFVTPNREPYALERAEASLVLRYRLYLQGQGHTVTRLRVIPAGEAAPLYSDLSDETDAELIEAKASVTRDQIRHAVGQLLDYGRFVEARARTVLVPSRPRDDLMAYLRSVGIGVVYPNAGAWTVVK